MDEFTIIGPWREHGNWPTPRLYFVITGDIRIALLAHNQDDALEQVGYPTANYDTGPGSPFGELN